MSKIKDLTGLKFGRLTVIKRLENFRQENGRTRTRWLCKCDCGNDYIADGDHIKYGNVVSCGCLKNEKSAERMSRRRGIHNTANTEDLTGRTFGELTVESFAGYYKRKARWNCVCSCGRKCVVNANHLLRGNIKSCKCKTRSQQELLFEEALKSKDIPYQIEYSFDDLRGKRYYKLRFDFAIFDGNGALKALVEIQGQQHYEDSNNGFYAKSEYDEKKQLYCKEKEIRLYVIKYDESIDDCIDSILK